ncbi:MAG: nucleotidyltransferase domain-containing protein [Planctomycetes bacterium]|nr:nucleotidyltransferase domain-containing protein [Planctomycetota bacterium]
MIDREFVLDVLRREAAELRARGVVRLALFGSFARGEARADSDLDFLVQLDRRTFDRYMDLKLHLEDLFQRRVDLVLWDRLRPELRPAVFAELIDAA